jgi:hypothetical protein
MAIDINDANVKDKQSFIEFLELLHQDYLENKDKWENQTLKDFLEALILYTEDIDGYYKNFKENTDANIASWKLFADILKGTRFYE